MTLQSKCEDACCVGWARGMDAISLPAPHLILLFVEKSSLCPARPLPQPSTACCCFIIEKSCCDRLREPWCGKMECIYLSTLGLVIPGQFSFGNRQNKTIRASRIGHPCAWINRRFFFPLLFLLHYSKCSWEDLERDENENACQIHWKDTPRDKCELFTVV